MSNEKINEKFIDRKSKSYFGEKNFQNKKQSLSRI